MTEDGKLYWMRVKGSCHPSLYLGETQASRYKYVLHVQKPSCCLVYKGGPKLDAWIEETNKKNEAEFNQKQAEFEKKYPPDLFRDGAPEFSPTLWLYEPVEVVAYMKLGKQHYKVKK